MTDVDNIIESIVNNPDKVASLKEKDIENCLEKVKLIFDKEKALIELKGDIVFVGDTHGDFETTKSVVKQFFNADHLVFLGDYIDREPMKWGSIYNLTYLLLLKCCYPEKIILLKGNHECYYIIPCLPYEFEDEIIDRFGSSNLHKKYVEVFKSMPLMVLANKVFAAHGGILKDPDLNELRKINKNDPVAIESLVWSDPALSHTFRGAGVPFNEDDLTKFLDRINAKVFIRGHDYNNLGVSIYKNRCLTIFTSSRYKEMGNKGILVAQTNKEIVSIDDIILEDFSTRKWLKYKVKKK
jgi:predicted phosphodiesterase